MIACVALQPVSRQETLAWAATAEARRRGEGRQSTWQGDRVAAGPTLRLENARKRWPVCPYPCPAFRAGLRRAPRVLLAGMG